MQGSFINHYKPDDHEFVKRTIHCIETVYNQVQSKLTDFVDPSKQKIITDLCNRYPNLQCIYQGAFPNAERKRALLLPEYWSYEAEDFQIRTFFIDLSTNSSFVKHGDYLGAILGLGIKREKIGDLVVHNTGAYVVTDFVIADYIELNLSQVNRYPALIHEVSFSELPIREQEFHYIENTVASLRLDNIIKMAYQMSRNKAVEVIQRGYVKYNWNVCEKVDHVIANDDVISVKGKDKIKIIAIGEPNKKGRIPVKIGRFM
ncbi:hypothetical protein BHU72_07765 [Desulfuribacillus stibiiarsenatis]|uniref:RNA-binding S4 domain-containing protein n=1 Tax=Desulfuribacillus stibiiarsenatis TaxID=1390249 RepID=A0A1E5L3Q5_9FIRM|nr:YlmH/Sll1252 family protein [Desulfuribacillus stibiiarsenatis]OEH84724.1 hypothetical protein BHU72_07765 [Desulfuribacillus stibiiarsenatis]